MDESDIRTQKEEGHPSTEEAASTHSPYCYANLQTPLGPQPTAKLGSVSSLTPLSTEGPIAQTTESQSRIASGKGTADSEVEEHPVHRSIPYHHSPSNLLLSNRRTESGIVGPPRILGMKVSVGGPLHDVRGE